MKLKIVSTLLFLAGSAFSQLIPMREDSGFMVSYRDASPFTFTLAYHAPAIAHETRDRVPTSLSLRESFLATPAGAENPRVGASLQSGGLHRFATDSVPAAAEMSAPTALDVAFFAADSHAQSGAISINPDQGVLALIAASTTP